MEDWKIFKWRLESLEEKIEKLEKLLEIHINFGPHPPSVIKFKVDPLERLKNPENPIAP